MEFVFYMSFNDNDINNIIFLDCFFLPLYIICCSKVEKIVQKITKTISNKDFYEPI